MPSAARQRIPAELWRSNHNRPSGSSPEPFSQDIQAHPGQCDMSDFDGMKIQSGKRSILTRQGKKYSPGNKRSGHSLPRRGSVDVLSESCENSDRLSYEMSTSPDSDSGLYYSVLESPNSFAMDSVEAPDPSQLPSPPKEWLRSNAADPGSTVKSLHSILGCHASAQKCA